MICQCGNCRETFDFSQLLIRQKSIGGVPIKEKACPFCESIGYTPLELYDKVAEINGNNRSFYQKVVEGWWT